MPVKGIEQTKRRMRETFQRIAGPMTERTLVAVLKLGAAQAALLTPVATSNLINSQTPPQIFNGPMGMWGRIGYTAKYAAAVHNAPGTLKGQNVQRHPASLGRVWDPRAEPGFLDKGFLAAMPAIKRAIKEGMKL